MSMYNQNSKKIEEFLYLIQNATKILILNSKPDGDSIASSIALNRIITKLGKDVKSMSAYVIPDYLKFLNESKEVEHVEIDKFKSIINYDLIIIVDVNEISRSTFNNHVTFHPQAKVVCVDHHKTIRLKDIDLPIIDSQAESTCGVLVDIFRDATLINKVLGVNSGDLIDSSIAYYLYAGIVSDTDFFGYSNVTAESFERAAYLRKFDFNSNRIILNFRETLSIEAFRFIQRYLPYAVINEEKRYAYLTVKKEFKEEFKLPKINEATNYMNRALLRIINVVDFSFVIKEIYDSKCSFGMRVRNNGSDIDLSKIAEHFGGGGHKQSAGGVVDMRLDDFEKEFNQYLNKVL